MEKDKNSSLANNKFHNEFKELLNVQKSDLISQGLWKPNLTNNKVYENFDNMDDKSI